ncbi:hypothetical protein K493DRAFT_310594 [Basidiobolus meristosporus CBS 931.73]|uniref:Uncharacterized protein n=1 Tax=Basidiobolus meristosporus CBS 931.73 TaxID=1314790 RepID=A0A1Y1Z893_9FUNG|nr:hypothetical protein K493DRAFT_310594 [Basidiobolus meristosporus CBS 931.73]|eukprot:ORY06482.1 hypothetical protein K493DRAFT_310594 [Basidiobolus meristosporus CBS 931.73]
MTEKRSYTNPIIPIHFRYFTQSQLTDSKSNIIEGEESASELDSCSQEDSIETTQDEEKARLPSIDYSENTIYECDLNDTPSSTEWRTETPYIAPSFITQRQSRFSSRTTVESIHSTRHDQVSLSPALSSSHTSRNHSLHRKFSPTPLMKRISSTFTRRSSTQAPRDYQEPNDTEFHHQYRAYQEPNATDSHYEYRTSQEPKVTEPHSRYSSDGYRPRSVPRNAPDNMRGYFAQSDEPFDIKSSCWSIFHALVGRHKN